MEHIIDLSTIDSAEVFHNILAQTLNFPDWYGHNLDALYDFLTELETPVHLILTNWDPNTDFAAGFESVLTDAMEFNSDFTYQFA